MVAATAMSEATRTRHARQPGERSPNNEPDANEPGEAWRPTRSRILSSSCRGVCRRLCLDAVHLLQCQPARPWTLFYLPSVWPFGGHTLTPV